MDKLLVYRRDLYSALSELLKEPSAEMIDELPDLIAFLEEAFSALGCPVPATLFQGWPALSPDLAVLRKAYSQSFCYPPKDRVCLLESAYRPWTTDQSAGLPGAHDRGYLFSDAAVHMQTLYGIYGLTPPEDFHAAPDHLCLQLEFAAHLLALGQEDRLQTFLAEHLDWVQELAEDAAAVPINLFYAQILAVTALFLDCEQKRPGSKKNGSA
jgi:TorA maturation chaperone TorD